MQKRSWFRWLGATVAISVLTLAAGCGGGAQPAAGGQPAPGGQPAQGAAPAKPPEEIKIGVVLPLSGALAQQGQDIKAAMELAADIVNSEYKDLKDIPFAGTKGLSGRGGATLKLIFADHQGDPNTGRAETERLITQEKVTLMSGAYNSAVTNTASQAAERAQVPFVTGTSSSPSLTERSYKWFFRTWPSDTYFIKSLFDYLQDASKELNFQPKSAGIIVEDTLWGQDSGKLFKQFSEQMGLKVDTYIAYKNNASSVDAEVEKLKATNPDVIFGAAYTSDAILIVKTMQKLNWAPKMFLGNNTGYSHPDLLKNVGNAATGIASRSVYNADLRDKKANMSAVLDLYQKKTGRPMPDTALGDFQVILVIADALNRSKDLSPAAIQQALKDTNIPAKDIVLPGWDGVKFDEKGQNVLVKPIIIQAQGDKFVTVWPSSFATSKTVFPMPMGK